MFQNSIELANTYRGGVEKVLYQFWRNAFGLFHTGSEFNRVIRKLLKGILNIGAKIDEVLPHIKYWNTHVQVLRELFERVRKVNRRVHPTRFFIGYPNIPFTGHVMGYRELEMEQEKKFKIGIRNARLQRKKCGYLWALQVTIVSESFRISRRSQHH